MDDLKIENYKFDLLALCSTCKKQNKCKGSHTDKICLRKKLAFQIAKCEYKKRLKKGEIL